MGIVTLDIGHVDWPQESPRNPFMAILPVPFGWQGKPNTFARALESLISS